MPIQAANRNYKIGDFVVSPAHGVGQFIGVEVQEYSGHKIEVLKVDIHTGNTKMLLRIPANNAEKLLRPLSDKDIMQSVRKVLKSRARIRKTMWSRRAAEYEAKINSGDPVQLAEVVRDLHRRDPQHEQSYSERQIYQTAIDRLAKEFAAIEAIDQDSAVTKLESLMKATVAA